MEKFDHSKGPPDWLVGHEPSKQTSWLIDLKAQQLVQVENLFLGDGYLTILPCLGMDLERVVKYIRDVRSRIVREDLGKNKVLEGEGFLLPEDLHEDEVANAARWVDEKPVFRAPASLPENGLCAYISSEDPHWRELDLGALDECEMPCWHIELGHSPFKVFAMRGMYTEVDPICAGEWIQGTLRKVSYVEADQVLANYEIAAFSDDYDY